MTGSRILPNDTGSQNQLSIFPTELGWFGVVGGDRGIIAATFGQPSAGDVHDRLARVGAISRYTSPGPWYPELETRLQAYTAGAVDDFADIEVIDSRTTDFQRKVVRVVRGIGYGQTLSYGEVADQAGSPGAARAVGQVMKTNPLPIIIPCHRVVASGRKLGGYSGAEGLLTKQRLLDLEGAVVGC